MEDSFEEVFATFFLFFSIDARRQSPCILSAIRKTWDSERVPAI